MIMHTMKLDAETVHFRILACLCSMPKAVRGMSAPMLRKRFDDEAAIQELAAAGLIEKRAWSDGPGFIWVPTAAGEMTFESLTGKDADNGWH
jgi:hypothetical protein